jgi:hypothetical protein
MLQHYITLLCLLAFAKVEVLAFVILIAMFYPE